MGVVYSNNKMQFDCKMNLESNVTVDCVFEILWAADKSQEQEMPPKYWTSIRMIVTHFEKIVKQPRMCRLCK